METILWGTFGGFVAMAATTLGAIPAVIGRSLSQRASDTMLGFAAGVMLSAAYFSLILPGIEVSTERTGSEVVAALIAGAGIALGAGFVAWLNATIPHEHFRSGPEGRDAAQIARIWLFVIAITIHNFPEGLSIGVAFGEGRAGGLSVMTGISIQDIPEGLAVAVAVVGLGYPRRTAFLTALGSGAAEPVGAFVGASLVSVSHSLLPWGLTFAAGAMLYIISHEIVPETHRNGHQHRATAGLIVGLIVMMILDVTLG
ncbi:ZIP family metal transporter [Wenxinia marina]|uniref:Putative divalent heavy-metal cations transporter n=1 Tax=Wenxinia marina DSM 24838 TaxID=1123501 RepID=A0A0D0NSZ5_9RHOB|nr:ZIP family metal transporter [Wenxinia marina]KIQ71320.1 putative divalent heavy-metal cations transporter [Wenxinia marina DSM 24838]GGL73865.1 ZIP family metal transporter [Wenxinia marina]